MRKTFSTPETFTFPGATLAGKHEKEPAQKAEHARAEMGVRKPPLSNQQSPHVSCPGSICKAPLVLMPIIPVIEGLQPCVVDEEIEFQREEILAKALE